MPHDHKYVILAGFVAFVAWAYVTDWIPSLRWIPHAFFGGILATVAGILYIVLTTSKGIYAKDDDYSPRHPVAPAFTKPEKWEAEKAALLSRAEYRRPLIFPEAVAFSKALDSLLDLILRDYVTSWYGAITPRPLFQHEIDRCIRSVLLTIVARITNFDIVQIGVADLLPMITAHLKEFYEAERLVRGQGLDKDVRESEELDLAIARKYRGGRIHVVAAPGLADDTAVQQEHLRKLVVRLLPLVLPDNMKSSSAVTVLIREIVTCAVLAPVMRLLDDPDTWNQLVVTFGRPMLRDRKAVRKVRAALEQNAPVSPKTIRGSQFPRLRAYDSERQFERFIRAIRHIQNLSEARRFRSEIMSQLRRDAAVDGQDAVYLRRLETGGRLLDQKIATLSTNGEVRPKLSLRPSSSSGDPLSKKKHASLREIIYDTSGLSYFMEFMAGLQLMRLVQFYLVADGYRGPLEGDHDELDPNVAYAPDRMDIAQMYESYLSKPEIQTSESAMRAVKTYLKKGVDALSPDYAAARQAVLQTQTQVYNRMRQSYFEDFKSSDLYSKWLGSDSDASHSSSQDRLNSSPLSPESARSTETSPVRTRRPQLAPIRREPELRRAVLSSTNLNETARTMSEQGQSRRSLDDTNTRSRKALFDHDVDDERMAQSLTSLRSTDSDLDLARRAREDEAHAVDAMQMALDGIVAEDDRDSLFSDPVERQSFERGASRVSQDHVRPTLSARSSVDQGRPNLSARPSERDKPSIASLGLVGGPSSRGVFVDDLFGDEAQKFVEDEREDSSAAEQTDEDQVQEAAPGDLGLTEAIDVLNADIEKLTAQKQIVDSLTAKAELTNNAAELRILKKSEQSLEREIKRKEMQKQQYVVQESDNSLYGRAAISIKSVMVGKEDDGHEYALYVIEVRRQAGEQMPAATWSVTRRYSQFHELHKRLRARFPSVRELDFPRRQALFTLQKDFVQRRRVVLERYLRSLLLVPAICRSRELRAFLSQSAIATTNGADGAQVDAKDFVTRIYNSVSDGMEEFLGNIPVLDQLSVAGQNLISATASQTGNGQQAAAIDKLDPAKQDSSTAAEAEAELNAYETPKGAEPFVKPICDLFLETFELSKGTSWLRGRTVVVVLHQLLGGTIERRVREAVTGAFEDESLVRYVDLLKTTMWPDGKLWHSPTPRSALEKSLSRKEASAILDALVPDLAGSVVGRTNAKAAGRKISAVMNNRKLKCVRSHTSRGGQMLIYLAVNTSYIH